MASLRQTKNVFLSSTARSNFFFKFCQKKERIPTQFFKFQKSFFLFLQNWNIFCTYFLNWFIELMKWFISKIAPYNLISPPPGRMCDNQTHGVWVDSIPRQPHFSLYFYIINPWDYILISLYFHLSNINPEVYNSQPMNPRCLAGICLDLTLLKRGVVIVIA